VYSFLVLLFQSLTRSPFHPSPSLLITYCSYKPFPQRLAPPAYPILHFTSPHSTSLASFTSLYCTSINSAFDNISLHLGLSTSLQSASLQFSMISTTLYFLLVQLNYHFTYPLFKSDWFAGETS